MKDTANNLNYPFKTGVKKSIYREEKQDSLLKDLKVSVNVNTDEPPVAFGIIKSSETKAET